MNDQTYNGWAGKGTRASAYATWRIGLELVNDQDYTEQFDEKPDESTLADNIQEYVEEFVFVDDPNQERLVSQYAAAFLDDVSWYELAEHILLDWPDDDGEAEDDEQ